MFDNFRARSEAHRAMYDFRSSVHASIVGKNFALFRKTTTTKANIVVVGRNRSQRNKSFKISSIILSKTFPRNLQLIANKEEREIKKGKSTRSIESAMQAISDLGSSSSLIVATKEEEEDAEDDRMKAAFEGNQKEIFSTQRRKKKETELAGEEEEEEEEEEMMVVNDRREELIKF